jgi:hypothetical protein
MPQNSGRESGRISEIGKVVKKFFVLNLPFCSMNLLVSGCAAAVVLLVSPLHAHANSFVGGQMTELSSNSVSPDIKNQLDIKASTERYVALSQLTAEQTAIFAKIADSQSEIWADTILEGEYESLGATRLDGVEGVYRKDQLVGYRITYSAQAWSTADCSYDSRDKATLVSCTPGRIVESAFVALDFKTWQRDEKAIADFVAGK